MDQIKNSFFVDMQGYYVSSKFLVTELAIVRNSLDYGSVTKHYVFKPPFAFYQLEEKDKQWVIWLERFLHGLMWRHGFVESSLLNKVLTEDIKDSNVVYVKGAEKVSVLKDILNCRVADFTDLFCPSVKFLNDYPSIKIAP